MSIVLNFIYKYFFEAIVVFLTGMITNYLIKQFGKERAEAIREAVLTAMLWAEEVFGIGNGEEKWVKAWQKIVEILQSKGITLSQKENNYVTTLMKATVPEINQITYSSLPEVVKSTRKEYIRSKDVQEIISDLKAKHENTRS